MHVRRGSSGRRSPRRDRRPPPAYLCASPNQRAAPAALVAAVVRSRPSGAEGGGEGRGGGRVVPAEGRLAGRWRRPRRRGHRRGVETRVLAAIAGRAPAFGCAGHVVVPIRRAPSGGRAGRLRERRRLETLLVEHSAARRGVAFAVRAPRGADRYGRVAQGPGARVVRRGSGGASPGVSPAPVAWRGALTPGGRGGNRFRESLSHEGVDRLRGGPRPVDVRVLAARVLAREQAARWPQPASGVRRDLTGECCEVSGAPHVSASSPRIMVT